jgi:hypothetical protein
VDFSAKPPPDTDEENGRLVIMKDKELSDGVRGIVKYFKFKAQEIDHFVPELAVLSAFIRGDSVLVFMEEYKPDLRSGSRGNNAGDPN